MRAAVSQRRDGSVALGEASRRRFLSEAGMEGAVAARQVHGARVLVATVADRGKEILGEGDALATAEPGRPLLVLSADCMVGAIADRSGRAVGAFHAGWRGVLAGAPAAAAREVARIACSSLPDLRVALGPAIGPCCYEVGEEIRAAFREEFGPRADAWFRPGARGRPHLDLPGAVRDALAGIGVPVTAIAPSPGCTLCGGDWFSHRRGDAGRQGLAVCLGQALRA